MTIVIPQASINETAFPCPHCGAHASQLWADCYGNRLSSSRPLPLIPNVEQFLAKEKEITDDDEKKAFFKFVEWARRMKLGVPFTETSNQYVNYKLNNVFISQCFNCERPSIWIHDRLLYPAAVTGEEPNPDMPPEILADFQEARTILDLSPRGACALLRLAVQKLCVHLGEKGKNIDDDIASLVKKGLDQMTADALDTVRVIGNEAVHPGQMDLKDDRNTAAELFYAVNFVVDQMITKRRKLTEIYLKLPPEKRAAIDQRNAKAMLLTKPEAAS